MTTTDTTTATDVESVEEFRARARAWIPANLPPAEGGRMMKARSDEDELAEVQRNRDLQRTLFDGGFAGICFPKEYGGQGLTPAHAKAFNEEMGGYAHPWKLQVPTFSPCAAVILEFGTHEQKLEHIPRMLRGEELWMQFLSEPGGGSDVAGAQTTATRDGDEWVLNGSKIWTTGAWWSDWGLCLARTDSDVPKHRGLSVFMFPIHQEGIDVHRIEMLDGNKEFCQEFLSDVRVPDTARVGQVNDGWTVGTRWMFYERTFNSSPLTLRPVGASGMGSADDGADLLKVALKAGRSKEAPVREKIGRAHAEAIAMTALDGRLSEAMQLRIMTDQAGTIGRLMHGLVAADFNTAAFEVAGSSGAVWSDDEEDLGDRGATFLLRQNSCVAGGTIEMARNGISERVLGMPREMAMDKGVAFREIPRGRPKSS